MRHVCVDRARAVAPISGTLARADPHRHAHLLAPRVYASFVRRVCVLGGESSGKTTLARALAERLGTAWVPEFGRELWQARGGQLRFEDMLRIATVQVRREEALARQARRWLICDTSPLTTACYSLALFGGVDAALDALASRPYDRVFVCAPDIPFVQDGTRRDPRFSRDQHAWYLEELGRRGVELTVLRGSLETRIARASVLLDDVRIGATTG